MYCLNCDTQDDQLVLATPICKNCGHDNSHVLKMLEEDDDFDDEDIDEEFREESEIRKRALVLYAVSVAESSVPRAEVLEWIKSIDLIEDVSPNELEYLSSAKPTRQQTINTSWRIEAVEALLWVLQEIDELTSSESTCDTDRIDDVFGFFMDDPDAFLQKHSMREESEVFEMLDTIYDQHWKIRDAQLNEQPIPENLNKGVIVEKHHALNWVTGYNNDNWDDVTTDT